MRLRRGGVVVWREDCGSGRGLELGGEVWGVCRCCCRGFGWKMEGRMGVSVLLFALDYAMLKSSYA